MNKPIIMSRGDALRPMPPITDATVPSFHASLIQNATMNTFRPIASTGQVCDLPPVGVPRKPANIPDPLGESRLAPGSWRRWPVFCPRPESLLGFPVSRPTAHLPVATSRHDSQLEPCSEFVPLCYRCVER